MLEKTLLCIWNKIQNISGPIHVSQKTKAKSGVSDLKDSQGILIRDNEEKANLLNDFFASVL